MIFASVEAFTTEDTEITENSYQSSYVVFDYVTNI